MSIYEVQFEGTIYYVKAENQEAAIGLLEHPADECYARLMGNNESVKIQPHGTQFSVPDAVQDTTLVDVIASVRLF